MNQSMTVYVSNQAEYRLTGYYYPTQIKLEHWRWFCAKLAEIRHYKVCQLMKQKTLYSLLRWKKIEDEFEWMKFHPENLSLDWNCTDLKESG